MAKIEDIKVTVELDDEDRKRIDTLIAYLKAAQAPSIAPQWPPYVPPVYPGYPRVYCGTSQYRDVDPD